MTTEQRTQIRQVIIAEKPEPVTNVTFNIVVGTVVPQTVTLRACPATIITFAPEFRTIGCRYFILADGRIVLVRPDTFTIILVVTA